MSSDDVAGPYGAWLRDPEVMKFILASPEVVNTQYLLDFISQNNNSPEAALFGIFDTGANVHIGNIRLVDVDNRFSRASLGIIIGNRDFWGRGFAAESITALTEYAHSKLGLKRIFAGCHSDNPGSIGAFLKAGYRRSEDISKHIMEEDGWADGMVFDHVMMTHIVEQIGTTET